MAKRTITADVQALLAELDALRALRAAAVAYRGAVQAATTSTGVRLVDVGVQNAEDALLAVIAQLVPNEDDRATREHDDAD